MSRPVSHHLVLQEDMVACPVVQLCKDLREKVHAVRLVQVHNVAAAGCDITPCYTRVSARTRHELVFEFASNQS